MENLDLVSLINKIVCTNLSYPNLVFAKEGAIYTCVNPYSYHLIRKNSCLYKNMDGIFVDGILMCLFIRFFWGYNIQRHSFDMSGIAADLFFRLNKTGESIYFIGAKQLQLNATVKHIQNSYPQIKIVGFRNGYFSSLSDRKKAIQDIIDMNPKFVIVGMGAPLQEIFAIELQQCGYKGIVFTCGGFFHQTVNGIKYYPDWINKYNLRAFYRLYKEKGLFKRLYNVLLEFPVLFMYDTFRLKLKF